MLHTSIIYLIRIISTSNKATSKLRTPFRNSTISRLFVAWACLCFLCLSCRSRNMGLKLCTSLHAQFGIIWTSETKSNIIKAHFQKGKLLPLLPLLPLLSLLLDRRRIGTPPSSATAGLGAMHDSSSAETPLTPISMAPEMSWASTWWPIPGNNFGFLQVWLRATWFHVLYLKRKKHYWN